MKRYYTVIALFLSLNLFADTNIYTPVLKAPTDGATKQAPNVLLDWEPVTGNIGLYYEVQISLDEAFTDPFMDSTELSSYTPSNLLFGTTYYWRVRAVDNTGTSEWSEIRSFTVTDIIDLSKPNNNAPDQDPNVALTWKIVTGLTSYEVQLDVTPDFDSPSLSDSLVPYTETVNNIATANLFFDQTYYWHVRGMHALDTTQWSDTRSFTVLNDLALKKPNNNSVDRMPNEVLRWENVNGILGYIYELDDNTSFTHPLIYQASTYSVNADTLDFGVKYYWRVAAFHAKDTSGWSTTWNFTVINQVLLASPADGSYGIPIFPEFSWEAITGVQSYKHQVDISPDFTDPVTTDVTPNSSTFQNYDFPGPALDSGLVYYWRVRAVNPTDKTEWSEVWSFTVLSLGIESEQLNGHAITLYPNPCKDHLYVGMDGGPLAGIQLSMINLVGQTLYSEVLDDDHGRMVRAINVGSFPEGIYLLQLKAGNEILTKKVVIYR